ncbi:hypothetical protein D9758_015161 [Tetrapyrgos nigripes]|uniref:AB hydrolase-1 domain-containing protein n=1 Tax=Tetrapyrgos nigripes TaxID=182062 RepID=A0A8H5FQN9_9AGAR|nr:hypothetical protein D9758_015161 [Tetrapyrgos nigripes]
MGLKNRILASTPSAFVEDHAVYIYLSAPTSSSMLFQALSSLLLALTASASPALLPRVDAPAPFNSSLFKDFNVSRGLNYHYYAVPADTGKPTLLFLHGFPSTSYDWRHQVAFFQDKGYGLLVPDMLGYGGTSKPLDPQHYVSSLVTRDIVNILDAEGIDQAVVVSHDWGSKTASRLANYFPERFLAYAFLVVGYTTPDYFATPFEERLSLDKAVLGYERFAYWNFMASKGADQLIMNNFDSFWNTTFQNDTTKTITSSPLGALEVFFRNDTAVFAADYVTPEERAIQMEAFRQGGIVAPLNWYKVARYPYEQQDDKSIPHKNALIRSPIFFGAALRDYITASAPVYMAGALVASNYTATIREYNSDHWLQMALPDQVNGDLLEWIEGLGL